MFTNAEARMHLAHAATAGYTVAPRVAIRAPIAKAGMRGMRAGTAIGCEFVVETPVLSPIGDANQADGGGDASAWPRRSSIASP
jgi:hypothetical protein